MQVNIMIKKKKPIISNAELSARNGVQKRSLQATTLVKTLGTLTQ